MKSLKILFFLIFGFYTYSQIVNIPDANFKAKLLEASPSNQIASTETAVYNSTTDTWSVSSYHKIDTNNDGEIQVGEALLIKYLDVNCNFCSSTQKISSLVGVLSFTNLQYLNCGANQLTSLNVQGLNNLQYLNSGINQLLSINLQGLNNLHTLFCNNNQLTSLNIQGLTNLKTLWCNYNQLSSINVQELSNLELLQCGFNQLSSLNLQGLINLKRLYCNNNQLPNLNVQGLTNLQILYCTNIQLTNLNVQGLTNLQILRCHENQITSLDVQGLINLMTLECHNNQLSSLNVQGLINLQSIECSDNQLLSLNVQELTNLQYLNCSGNLLTNLFIKNGYSDLTNYGFSNNPNLQYVCCSDNQLTQVQQNVTQNGYTNCHINTYCSFTPGGNHNTITGPIKYEPINATCDVNSLPFKNVKVQINDGTTTSATSTNATGTYNFFPLSGSFDITPVLENPTYFNVSPATVNQNFTDNNNNLATHPFCITPNGVNNDLEIVLAPHGNILPNSIAKFDLICKNKGNTTLTPQVFLSFSNDHLSFSSTNAVSYTSAPGLLDFDLDPLQPFETKVIEVIFDVFGPSDVPPVNVGDNLTFTATINPVVNDQALADNTFVLQEVVASTNSPLSITCLEGLSEPTSSINNYLHYRINFANTSQEIIDNVVVKIVLDPNLFDVSSLQLLHASAPIYVRINQNTVEYIFENINLAAASSSGGGGGHGHVIIKIKPNNSLEAEDSVMQQANIFYDYNAPLPTNVAETVFQNLSIHDNFNPYDFSIYPNPIKEELNIKTTEDIKKVEIFDTNGRLIQLFIDVKNENSFDISKLPIGLYFVRISTQDKIATLKIVKEAP